MTGIARWERADTPEKLLALATYAEQNSAHDAAGCVARDRSLNIGFSFLCRDGFLQALQFGQIVLGIVKVGLDP